MNAIKDYQFYTTEMCKALQEKLFFMDKINVNYLMDYGCADGSLIQSMHQYYPGVNYIGYDIDEEMIKKAKDKKIPNSLFTTNLKLANTMTQSVLTNSGILCSSVIHEVYSYGNQESIKAFWDNLYGGTYDYVIIRDMALSEKEMADNNITNPSDLIALKNRANPSQISDFENIWGSLNIKKNFIHFLLKYRYIANWDREVAENYLPVTIEDHLKAIPDNYEIVFFEHEPLPFIQQTVKNDFGIFLENKTHIKLIIKKK